MTYPLLAFYKKSLNKCHPNKLNSNYTEFILNYLNHKLSLLNNPTTI